MASTYAQPPDPVAGRQVLQRETKAEGSDDFLPLPPLCPKALRMRHPQQASRGTSPACSRSAIGKLSDAMGGTG